MYINYLDYNRLQRYAVLINSRYAAENDQINFDKSEFNQFVIKIFIHPFGLGQFRQYTG